MGHVLWNWLWLSSDTSQHVQWWKLGVAVDVTAHSNMCYEGKRLWLLDDSTGLILDGMDCGCRRDSTISMMAQTRGIWTSIVKRKYISHCISHIAYQRDGDSPSIPAIGNRDMIRQGGGHSLSPHMRMCHSHTCTQKLATHAHTCTQQIPGDTIRRTRHNCLQNQTPVATTHLPALHHQDRSAHLHHRPPPYPLNHTWLRRPHMCQGTSFMVITGGMMACVQSRWDRNLWVDDQIFTKKSCRFWLSRVVVNVHIWNVNNEFLLDHMSTHTTQQHHIYIHAHIHSHLASISLHQPMSHGYCIMSLFHHNQWGHWISSPAYHCFLPVSEI